MPAQYIADGYEAVKTFEENGFYPKTEVRFRPLTGIECRQIRLRLSDMEYKNGKQTEAGIKASEEHAAEFLATRIVSWSVVDKGGHALPITKQTILGLEQHLSGDLLMLLIGEIAPDVPGDEQADAKN